MDTKQLTTFVTLAEVNNYIKAADRLEELMKEATKAMRRYQGMDEEEEDFDDGY